MRRNEAVGPFGSGRLMQPVIENATVGSIATFPARFKTIEKVVANIAPQVDWLFIYVNETMKGWPNLKSHKNITVLDGREYAGDLSANGKIFSLRFVKNCKIFIFDDDFIYPADYVEKNLNILNLFDGHCVVSTHGSNFPSKVDWYYDRTKIMMSKRATDFLNLCSLAGSGTICFDQRHLPVNPEEFLDRVWVDLKISLIARKNGLPIWVLPRSANWLQHIPMVGLYDQMSSRMTHHTEYARDVDWSFAIYRDIANSALKRVCLPVEALQLSQELTMALKTGNVPRDWLNGALSMKRRADYCKMLLKREI
ncbi:hypothetical protein N9P17_07790 [Tateyamaria sp.]|nr:hypothetical protein [Tateyamaria sp.]